MKIYPHSIRTFIGAEDYNLSRKFYRQLGFEESVISDKMSYFYIDQFGFYLQDYYVKDWVNNSMVFLEVDDVERHLSEIKKLRLHEQYEGVRMTEMVYNDWGKEFFLYDPSGVLWHFGEFKSNDEDRVET